MVEPPIEYERFEEGRHVNYWELNPVLQEESRRLYPDDEFEWAEEKLQEFGHIVGHTIADNAGLIDRLFQARICLKRGISTEPTEPKTFKYREFSG